MIIRGGAATPSTRELAVGEGQTRIMGIVNTTPDSFSDGGAFLDPDAAIAHGLQLLRDGADLLDIGGESTRPGYRPVSVDEQIRRVEPVVRGLRAAAPEAILAVDTTRAGVAEAVLAAGADWINDTSALTEDPDLAGVVAAHRCPIVLMHRFDPPRTPSNRGFGREFLAQMVEGLESRVRHAEAQGIDPRRILLDPGLGFGTLFEDNLVAMAEVGSFRTLHKPLLFGPSRKSFIGQMTGKDAADRVYGTAAAVAILAVQGVEVLRVHDVGAMVDVVRVADELRSHRIE